MRFRASEIANLMTDKKGATITEKQLEYLNSLTAKVVSGKELTVKQTEAYNELIEKRDMPFELSDTAKSWVEKLWRQQVKGVKEFLANKYIEKGLSEEQMGINLLSEMDGNYYEKNEESFDNGVMSGTPDIIFEDRVIDIKSSWDLKTYMNADLTDLYYGQLQTYMELTGKRKASLCYCLVDTPDKLVDDEKRRVMWKLGITDPELDEHRPIFEQIERNFYFSDYPKEERVKRYDIEYDAEYIKKLYDRCEHALVYFNSIKLGGLWVKQVTYGTME